jgi:hypothetical protein
MNPKPTTENSDHAIFYIYNYNANIPILKKIKSCRNLIICQNCLLTCSVGSGDCLRLKFIALGSQQPLARIYFWFHYILLARDHRSMDRGLNFRMNESSSGQSNYRDTFEKYLHGQSNKSQINCLKFVLYVHITHITSHMYTYSVLLIFFYHTYMHLMHTPRKYRQVINQLYIPLNSTPFICHE